MKPDLNDNFNHIKETRSPEPPTWGKYGSAAAFYASDEWLAIVSESLEDYLILLGQAYRLQNREAIKFYDKQIKACESQLNLIPVIAVAFDPRTQAQQSLFDSLIPR